MEIKAKFNDLWKKYGIKIIIAIVVILVLFLVGKYYAYKQVNDFINGVKAEWSATIGREFQDNIAKLQQKQEDQTAAFNAQKADIVKLKNDNKRNIRDVFSGNDTSKMSQLFDSTIDSVELEK